MKNLEDVVYADQHLNIGTMRVHHIATIREFHQHRVTGMERRIVLVRQFAPKTLHAKELAPL